MPSDKWTWQDPRFLAHWLSQSSTSHSTQYFTDVIRIQSLRLELNQQSLTSRNRACINKPKNTVTQNEHTMLNLDLVVLDNVWPAANINF